MIKILTISKKVYDLEEGTTLFGKAIIKFAKKIPKNVITVPIIGKLMRAGTSVSSNYGKADGAESKKDFEHKFRSIISKSKNLKQFRGWALEILLEIGS